MKRIFPAIFGISILILLLLPRWDQPLSPDELHWQVASESLSQGGRPHHIVKTDKDVMNSPHAYLLLATLTQKIFGPGLSSTRMLGVACLIVALLGGCFFSKRPWLFTFMVATCPILVQGTLIPVNHNAYLIPMLLLLVLTLQKYLNEPSLKHTIYVIAVTVLSLWGRLTVTLIFLLMFCTWPLLSLPVKKKSFAPLLLTLLSLILFTATWVTYCHFFQYNAWEPYEYVVSSVIHKSPSSLTSWFVKPLRNLYESTLWIGLPLLVLWIFCLKNIVKLNSKKIPSLFLPVATSLAFLGYYVVGGCIFGFPKYQSPLVIVMIWVLCQTFPKFSFEKSHFLLLFSGILLFSLHPDPIYDLRYLFRSHLIESTPSESLKFLFPSLFPVFIFPLLLYGVAKFLKLRDHGLIPIIMIIFLSQNIALSLHQSRHSYQTGYSYGQQDMPQIVSRYQDKDVIATSDVIYHLNSSNPYLSNSVWNNETEMLELLQDRPQASLIMTPTVNTPHQLKRATQATEVAAFLKENYDFKIIGSFYVWDPKRK